MSEVSGIFPNMVGAIEEGGTKTALLVYLAVQTSALITFCSRKMVIHFDVLTRTAFRLRFSLAKNRNRDKCKNARSNDTSCNDSGYD